MTTVPVRFAFAVSLFFVVSSFGRAFDAAQQLTIWDGVYTREQADRGEKIYADRCARCHGDALQGMEAAPALVGTTFYTNWDGETLDALFERMRITMPLDRPGSLTRPENADILAYLLRVAAYPSGKMTLDPQGGALTRVRMLMYRPDPK